ncbi:aspartate/glutamate racemase family protein [Bacillus sp. HNG]|uniref:aspartate/glutamate racemase family protein n=1 Tax=Bacillus sp. HNG TaxID=2293325 RepID=UPI000E2ED2C8|nr:amino acid racemase [Bacillus sp. HNG]RFB12610.1 aspartate/glutamate racemase family protein [Bacillus sp. HNG]
MEQKTLGVIGGMGPKATSVFFDKIVNRTEAHQDQDHLNMVILNHATLPDRTRAILTNTGETFLNAVKNDFKLLEAAGVANIAIPCNTSHYFYNELQKMTKIPIINMVEETIKDIHDMYGEGARIGILATNGTIQSGIYADVCEKYKLNLHAPNDSLQEKVMDIIYNNVKSDLDVDSSQLEELIMHLVEKENCKTIILACTELSCIKLNDEAAKYSIDAMNVLVERSIVRSGKHLK